MSKLFVFLLTMVIAISLPILPAKAAPMDHLDQGCAYSLDVPTGISINSHVITQVFSSPKNTLDAVVIAAYSLNNPNAKMRVKVANATSMAVAGVIAEKTIGINNSTDWYTVDFSDVPMPSGIYIIIVEPVHQDMQINVFLGNGECYPGGQVIIDGQADMERDIFFYVSAYDSVTTTPQEPVDTPDDNSIASPSDQSAAITPSDRSIAPTTSESNSQTVESTATTLGDTANTNEKTAYSEKEMTDEELQALTNWILEDYERNKSHGAFGLGGMVGSILTWPVVIGAGIFFVILIIVFIIVLTTRKKKVVAIETPSDNKTEE